MQVWNLMKFWKNFNNSETCFRKTEKVSRWCMSWFCCVYTCEHCVCENVREHVWKINFSTKFRRTRGKWQTNRASRYMKIVGEIGKSSHKRGRQQKFSKHGTHWTANILCVRWKNWQGMIRKELFANLVLITQTLYLWTKCSQVYMQLYMSWRAESQ